MAKNTNEPTQKRNVDQKLDKAQIEIPGTEPGAPINAAAGPSIDINLRHEHDR